MTPKEEYKLLLDSGMFWEFFPKYSERWESDAGLFIKFLIKRKKNI